jgi:hypothetical protein
VNWPCSWEISGVPVDVSSMLPMAQIVNRQRKTIGYAAIAPGEFVGWFNVVLTASETAALPPVPPGVLFLNVVFVDGAVRHPHKPLSVEVV